MAPKKTLLDLIIEQKKIAAGPLYGNMKKEEVSVTAITRYAKLGKIIACIISGFKCEKCKISTGLTFHHAIEKGNEKLMNYSKFIRQRHYFDNIVVLCRSCHDEIHYEYVYFGNKKVPTNHFIEEIKQKSYSKQALID